MAHDALRAELGAPPPKGLAAQLSDEESERLATTIHAAREHQRAALAQAGEAAFNHIPRLLRGPIRRLVGA